MSVQLNHTIVHARHSDASATNMAEILGLGAPGPIRAFPHR